MRIFNYTGKSKDGEVVSGEIEAENESAAARVLTSREIVPITIVEGVKQGLSFFNKVSLKEKVIMIRQLATMINAGLPISQSLETLAMQTKDKNVQRILQSAVSDVEGGAQLSNAFSRFPDTFSAIDITLIASGETSGSLDKALLRMADQLEKEQSLIRKVRSALIYPIFVLVVVIVVVAVMVIYVMPQMEGLYSSFNAKLPFLTQMMISLSHFLARFAPFVIAIVAGATAYLAFAIRRPKGRKMWDQMKIHIPGFNQLLIRMYMARFSRTLSGLVASGVPLLDSLNIVSKAVGNVVYEEALRGSAEKVKSGVALSDTLRENELFPPVVPQMISVGEKTGELDGMLSNLADYYEEEVDEAVKNISDLIEPIMIVVLGGIVVVILLAIMMPIYNVGKIV